MLFQLNPSIFQDFKKKLLLRQLLFCSLPSFAWLLPIPIFNESLNLTFFRYLLIVVFLVSLARAVFAAFKAVKKAQTEWHSFQILVSSELIAKTQTNVERVELKRNTINRIREIPGSGLLIQGASGGSLFVPVHLNGYAQLKAILLEWTPIEVTVNTADLPVTYAIEHKQPKRNINWFHVFRPLLKLGAVYVGVFMLLVVVLLLWLK